MDIDQALQASNPHGRTQILIFTACALMNIQGAMVMLGHVFLAEVPPHHCSFNSTYMMNDSIPRDGKVFAKCEEYVNPLFTKERQACSNGWVYETELTGKSIVSEWDLVCDKDFLPGLSQSLLLAGFGLGSLVGGPLADTYGRRPTIIGAVGLFNAVGLLVSIAPNFPLYVTLRLLMGGIFKCIRIPLGNLIYEFLPPKHRPVMGLMPFVAVIFGYMVMTGFGYYVRGWRYFHLLIMSPCVILMVVSWFIPESVRWIISQGDVEKAEIAMQKVAKFNKAENFPNPVFTRRNLTDEVNQPVTSFNPEKERSDSMTKDEKRNRPTALQMVVQLFKQPLLTVTLVLSFDWAMVGMIYFGFALSSGYFTGNPYINFIMICLADVPAILPAIYLVKKVGNVRPIFCGFFGAAVTMATIAMLPHLVETLGQLWFI